MTHKLVYTICLPTHYPTDRRDAADADVDLGTHSSSTHNLLTSRQHHEPKNGNVPDHGNCIT
jgi:hypothetical protein